MEQNKENVTEVTMPSTEHLAMEILKQEQERSKAKNTGIIGLIIAIIVIAIVLSIINYKNDCDWRMLFSDYDFISQDGEGINNANYGNQGDINNGSETEVKEK